MIANTLNINDSKTCYNILTLIEGINIMKMIKDLGMHVSGSRKYRKGIFLCPKCDDEFEMWVANGKKATACKPCARRRHGMSNTPPYRSWQGMFTRTTNPKNKGYEFYKDKVPPKEWETFQGFWDDMEESYIEGYSIERVDNDKPYSKENCVWADNYTQAQNKQYTCGIDGFQGVKKMGKRYMSKITSSGKCYYLGMHDTAIEAAKIRDAFIVDNGTKHPLNFSQGVHNG